MSILNSLAMMHLWRWMLLMLSLMMWTEFPGWSWMMTSWSFSFMMSTFFFLMITSMMIISSPLLTKQKTHKKNKQRKQTKENKKKKTKKRRKKTTKKNPKYQNRTFQFSVVVFLFLVCVSEFPFWHLGPKSAHPKNTIEIGVSASFFFEKQLCVTKRPWLDKNPKFINSNYHFWGTFFFSFNNKKTICWNPYFIVLQQT